MASITKSELIKLQRILTTDGAIGKKFGITRQAVHQLRRKYGVTSAKADNPQRNKKIIELYKSGKSGTVIAMKLNLSVSQTYRIIKESSKKKGKKS